MVFVEERASDAGEIPNPLSTNDDGAAVIPGAILNSRGGGGADGDDECWCKFCGRATLLTVDGWPCA